MKNFKNCIQCLDSSVNVYDTRVTSVGCGIAMYGEFSVSNATGSFQNHCSVASQMNPFADEPSSSGTGAKRPIRRRDMTALLAEVALPSPMNSRSERGSKIKALAALVTTQKE